MNVGKIVQTVTGASKAAAEMNAIVMNNENKTQTIDTEVIRSWYRRVTGLVMMVERMEINSKE